MHDLTLILSYKLEARYIYSYDDAELNSRNIGGYLFHMPVDEN